MKLLVCSGATVPFTELVSQFDRSMLEFCNERGITDIEVQYGHAKSSFIPFPPHLTGFDFVPTLKDKTATADIVVTHAGTGSILDALRSPNQPKVVAVVNAKLMDNHQLELAEKLAEQECIVMAGVDGIRKAIDEVLVKQLKPLAPPTPLAEIVPELV